MALDARTHDLGVPGAPRRVPLEAARVAAPLALVLAAALASAFGSGFVRSFVEAGRAPRFPFGSDFAFFWTVSAALRGGGVGAVLDPATLRTFAPYAVGGDFYHWVYPPFALFVCAPLAALPFAHAFAAWSLAGFALYLTMSFAVARRASAVLLAAGFPAVFHTLANGQLTFFVFALLGGALLALPSRPVLAGVLIGALAFKPQHAVLVPLALVAGRHWRAFASAAVTVVAWGLATALAFGVEAWTGSLRGLAFARGLVESGGVPHYKYSSAFTAIRMAGGGISTAYAVQALAAVVAACAVAWLWSRPVRHELKAAGLVVGGLLANFYSFHYDLTLLGLALAFALRLGGWSPRAWVAWGVAWLGIAGCAFVARDTGVQLAPVALGALLLVVVRRAREESGREPAPARSASGALSPASLRSSAG